MNSDNNNYNLLHVLKTSKGQDYLIWEKENGYLVVTSNILDIPRKIQKEVDSDCAFVGDSLGTRVKRILVEIRQYVQESGDYIVRDEK